MLCECVRMDGYVEHRDMYGTYVLWVLHSDASHVVFLHKRWLDGLLYNNGSIPFLELLRWKGHEEGCKMISRTLLATLGYKPDYLAIVADDDGTGAPLASGFSMGTITRLSDASIASIRSVAEGDDGNNNILGRRLSELCGTLADRGFFHDPKNKRKYRQQDNAVVITA